MKKITISIPELLAIVLAFIGLVLLAVKILEILSPEPAPVVNVTVNLAEATPKELTAGDHVKGLFKIGWNKLCEGVISFGLLGK